MTKEKFTEMFHNQQELFEDRRAINQKIVDMEVGIIQDEVIKSNAKKDYVNLQIHQVEKATSKDLKVKLLNHLLKQNKLSHRLSSSKGFKSGEEEDLRLANHYYKILHDPEKVVEDYNKANKYEKDIRITKKTRR